MLLLCLSFFAAFNPNLTTLDGLVQLASGGGQGPTCGLRVRGRLTVGFVGVIDRLLGGSVILSMKLKQCSSFISGRTKGAQAVFGDLGSFACFLGKHCELLGTCGHGGTGLFGRFGFGSESPLIGLFTIDSGLDPVELLSSLAFFEVGVFEVLTRFLLTGLDASLGQGVCELGNAFGRIGDRISMGRSFHRSRHNGHMSIIANSVFQDIGRQKRPIHHQSHHP